MMGGGVDDGAVSPHLAWGGGSLGGPSPPTVSLVISHPTDAAHSCRPPGGLSLMSRVLRVLSCLTHVFFLSLSFVFVS